MCHEHGTHMGRHCGRHFLTTEEKIKHLDFIDGTIDVLNKNEFYGNNFSNEKWHNKARQRGELIETKPDKMPVAIHEHMPSFTNHCIQLEQGDNVYLFSDGYPDQFGGPKGKKFMYKSLKRLLVQVADHPMAEQQKILEQTIDDWQGSIEQIDDIVFIGIKGSISC